jgi:NADH dehydrogenase FAD-containing subunit
MERARLVLAGGGHVQLAVLRRLARARPAGLEVVLVSAADETLYSGMLPGVLAGAYLQQALAIPLAPLAAAAGARFVQAEVTGLAADARVVRLADGTRLDFDWLSLGVGSGTVPVDAGAAAVFPVRPAGALLDAWPRLRGAVRDVGVAGGGAGGVEVALAVKAALPGVAVTLWAPGGVLHGHGAGAARRALRHLAAAGVAVRAAPVAAGHDLVLAASGAAAPAWLRLSGLMLDAGGFVAVDAGFRSVSHERVFAGGDVAGFPDRRVTKSGLWAVRAGPVLADNLLAVVEGRAPTPFRPWKPPFYLLATRPGHAIAAGAGWSAEGAGWWWLKDRIDRAYVARHGGGEAFKAGAQV